MDEATFAAGCFWGVEHHFALLRGVVRTEVGYAGGSTPNPTYKEVCTGRTGHAEAVHLEFDPEKISYAELLEHFWKIHDPTTPNRQGPDIGTQYRAAVFYHSERQRDLALDSIKAVASRMAVTVVTEIAPAGRFWRAEEYHQRYFEKNPGMGCHL